MRLFTLMPLFLLPLLFAACTDMPSEDTETKRIVYVFYTPHGLGDLSFCDSICRGVTQSELKYGFSKADIVPDSWAVAEDTLCTLLTYLRDTKASPKTALCIFCDTLYLSLLEKHQTLFSAGLATFLAFDMRESDIPHSLKDAFSSVDMPFYGVCYEAGALTKALYEAAPSNKKTLIISADKNRSDLNDAIKGFAQGLGIQQIPEIILSSNHEAASNLDVYYITADEPFNAAGFLYQQSAWIFDREYSTVFPLCGGSIMGLIRYNREQERQSTVFCTIGMDADMSIYTEKVPFSVVKHADKAVSRCIAQWQSDGSIPRCQSFGLESGYLEMLISEKSPHKTSLMQTLQSIHQTAIEQEAEYEKNRT